MKRVVKTKEVVPVVSLEKTDPKKIYAIFQSGAVWKLHRTEKEQYSFVSLCDSIVYWNGIHPFEELIERTIKSYEVFEFDNLKEFLEWSIKCVSQ